MSKFFKRKSTPVAIPEASKSEIPPRSQDEIDKEYTQLCISIGDRTVKAEGLKEEIQQMFNYARKLGAESARRQELNKQAPPTQETSAPVEQVAT